MEGNRILKQRYDEAEIKIIIIDEADVIATSNLGGWEGVYENTWS